MEGKDNIPLLQQLHTNKDFNCYQQNVKNHVVIS